MNTSPVIKEKAPLILAEIKKAKSVLLHCHPSPDPDSVCSALAMKFACEQLGVKATVIKGDSEIPEAFMHFPGAETIVKKNFGEIDLKDFDLFLIVDTASPSMISYKKVPIFPLPIKTIVIDHHRSNTNYAEINLVDECSSVAFIIFQLLNEWKIQLDRKIALNIFIGMYTDSGAFKYPPVSYREFEAAAILTKIAPDFPKAIFLMDNTETKEFIFFERLALDSIQTFLGDNLVITSVSNEQLVKNNIPVQSIHGGIPPKLISVVGWNIGMTIVEYEPNKVKVSMRSRDVDKFDVSKLAVALGGGGHRAAAGIKFSGMNIEDAKKVIVAKAKELYNL